ncbi:hypothetical protein C0995_009913 [Termitomyces sp. Mi166|nr:hypothetical protein C0995_009913 [Termitomyces sp. Mi166\
MTQNDNSFHMDVSAYRMDKSNLADRRTMVARASDMDGNSWDENVNEMLRDSIIWAEQGYNAHYPLAMRMDRELTLQLVNAQRKLQEMVNVSESDVKALKELEATKEENGEQLKRLNQLRLELDHIKKRIRMKLK